MKKYGMRVGTLLLFVSLVCACFFIPALAEEGEPTDYTLLMDSAGMDSASGSSVAPEDEVEPESEPEETPAPEAEAPTEKPAVTGEAVVYAEEPVSGRADKPAQEQTAAGNDGSDGAPVVVEPDAPAAGTDGAGQTVRNGGIAVRAVGAGEKKKITAAAFTFADLPLDTNEFYVTVGGIRISEPGFDLGVAGISQAEYNLDIDDNLQYVFKTTGKERTVFAGDPISLDPGTYNVYITFEDSTKVQFCQLGEDADQNVLDTGKEIMVSYYDPGVDKLVDEAFVGGKADRNNVIWYRSVTLTPVSGYQFVDETTDSSTGETIYSVSAEQSYEHTTDNQEKELFLAHLGSVVGKREMGPYQIDTVKPGATLPATGETTFYKSTDSLTLSYTLTDAATASSGASGVDSLEVKLTNTGSSGTDLQPSEYNSVATRDQNIQINFGGITGTKTASFSSLNKFSNGDRIYAYTKVTDVAGNSYYFSQLVGRIDEGSPRFSSSNTELNDLIKNDSDAQTGLIMFSGSYDIVVSDPNLTAVDVSSTIGSNPEIVEKDGNKYATITISRPDLFTEGQIVARDGDNNINTLNLRLVPAELTIDMGEGLDFGTVTYGYVPATAESDYIGPDETEYHTKDGESVVGRKGSAFTVSFGADCQPVIDTELTFTNPEGTDSTFVGTIKYPTLSSRSASAQYWISPREQLDAGSYTVNMKLAYTIGVPTSSLWGRAVVLGEGTTGTIERNAYFSVDQAPLQLTYANGRSIRSTDTGSTELYKSRPGNGELAGWTDRLSFVETSLKYGQKEKDVRDDLTFREPTIVAVEPEGDGILDEDGYIIGSGLLYFAIDADKASTNYRYPAVDAGPGENAVTGRVNCVEVHFTKSEGGETGSYYVTPSHSNGPWYTSDVTIGPERGFRIMNAGTGKCQYDSSTGEVWITEKTYIEYDKDIPIDQQFSNKSIKVKDEAVAGEGVVQFFYQYDEKSKIVSDLMYEFVLIDKSRPGYAWKDASGETPLAEFPYFQLYQRVSREFFSFADTTITVNKNDPLTLYSIRDDESGIRSIRYLILDDKNATRETLRNHVGWRELSTSGGSYYLTGTERKSGYLFIELKNNAGLSTFLYLEDRVEYTARDEDRIHIAETITLPSVTYGYQYVDTTPIKWTDDSPDGKYLSLDDVQLETWSSAFTLDHSPASGLWYLTPKLGMDAGTYTGTLVMTFSDGKKRIRPVSFTVQKRTLSVSYILNTSNYYKGQRVSDEGRWSITGFVPGEGRMDSEDGTVKKAAEYVDPKIDIPGVASQTVWLTPYGGKARNYSFDYNGFYLSVVKRIPQRGVHYSVSMQESANGWSGSRILLRGGTGSGDGRYLLSRYEDGHDPMDFIELAEDTANGSVTFYIVDTQNGEIIGPEVYQYKIDTHPPEIEGAKNGESFVTNLKQLIITDANLDTVSVNGVNQSFTGNRLVLSLTPDSATQEFLIVATDMGGLQTTRTIYLRQPDGSKYTESPKETITPIPTQGPVNPQPVTTPAPGGDGGSTDATKGDVIPDIQLLNGAPDTYICDTDNRIAKVLLDNDEQLAFQGGSDLRYRLLVRDVSTEVSQSDKEKVFSVLGDYTVAQYLNVTLWKRLGSGTESQVLKTDKPLSVTFGAPTGLPGGPKNYRFAVVRVTPDGSTELLEDTDEVPAEVTVSTNRFDAVYALAYRKAPKKKSSSDSDTEKNDDDKPASDNSANHKKESPEKAPEMSAPDAGDHAPVIPTAIAFGVSFIGMIVAVILRRRHYVYEYVYEDEEEQN